MVRTERRVQAGAAHVLPAWLGRAAAAGVSPFGANLSCEELFVCQEKPGSGHYGHIPYPYLGSHRPRGCGQQELGRRHEARSEELLGELLAHVKQ